MLSNNQYIDSAHRSRKNYNVLKALTETQQQNIAFFFTRKCFLFLETLSVHAYHDGEKKILICIRTLVLYLVEPIVGFSFNFLLVYTKGCNKLDENNGNKGTIPFV